MEVLAFDQQLNEAYYCRAEWYLDPANKTGFDGNELEAICEVATFFSVYAIMEKAEFYDEYEKNLGPGASEFDAFVYGEGGLLEILVKAVPEYVKLENFLAEVIDGEDCPLPALWLCNSFDSPTEPDWQPKFAKGDHVVIPARVFELDGYEHPEKYGLVLDADRCQHCGHESHPGMDYLVALEDGTQIKVWEGNMRFEDISREMVE
jgi:hypothetical protein